MRGGKRSGARLAAPAVAVAALLAHAPANAAPARPACVSLAFSPTFAKDRVVLCAGRDAADVVGIYRSGDGGRSWRRIATAPGPGGVNPEVTLSPLFPRDNTFFLIGSGVFRTTDGARTWTRIQEGATRVVPFVETAGAPAVAPRAAVVAPFPAVVGVSSVIDPVLGSRKVPGTVHQTVRFIVPPDYAATRSAVAFGTDLESDATTAYACRHDFVCVEPLTTFELGYDDAGPLGGPFTHYYVGSSATRYSTYRSRDFGRTWSRWTTLEAALRRHRVVPFHTYLGFAVAPDDPKRIFVNVRGDWLSKKADVPAWQLLRSDDGGTSWRRVGYSWGPKQRGGSGGTLPWNHVGGGWGGDPWTGAIHAPGGGRLYVAAAEKIGDRVVYQGAYCSRDGGVSWRRGC